MTWGEDRCSLFGFADKALPTYVKVINGEQIIFASAAKTCCKKSDITDAKLHEITAAEYEGLMDANMPRAPPERMIIPGCLIMSSVVFSMMA